MKVASPCKDCPNRHPACHDSCNMYKTYKADLFKEKSVLYVQKYNTRSFTSGNNLRKYSALGRVLTY